MVNPVSHLIVKAREREACGILACGEHDFPCALGPAGLTETKVEGDGATPIGAFRLVRLYYRADRVVLPDLDLPTSIISPKDGWCDDPKHAAYNSPVALPFGASHETLWRDDHAYDICIVLDYNLTPAIPGRGSAIFFHLAKSSEEGLKPTEGCVALEEDAMRKVLAQVNEKTVMVIQPE